MINILVADDDDNIRELITIVLRKENYNVIGAENGVEALKIMESENIDFAIVDIMMPLKDGWELTEEIRDNYDIPILIATAKDNSIDKVKGFRIGADDYLVKPFDLEEMVARVKAMLRRYKVFSNDKIRIGNCTLNYGYCGITVEDNFYDLPLKEFQLIFKLANYPGKVFTREELIYQIWGADYEGDDRTVDVHIKRLREKIEEINADIKIVTIRGLGYKLEEI